MPLGFREWRLCRNSRFGANWERVFSGCVSEEPPWSQVARGLFAGGAVELFRHQCVLGQGVPASSTAVTEGQRCSRCFGCTVSPRGPQAGPPQSRNHPFGRLWPGHPPLWTQPLSWPGWDARPLGPPGPTISHLSFFWLEPKTSLWWKWTHTRHPLQRQQQRSWESSAFLPGAAARSLRFPPVKRGSWWTLFYWRQTGACSWCSGL